jgi:hypothetical protein
MKTTKKWSKVLLAGMAALVLAFGLVVLGCGSNGDPDGKSGETENNNPKKITITGINGESGEVVVILASKLSTLFYVATGEGTISNNSVTVSMGALGTGIDWTGTGSYYMIVGIKIGNSSALHSYYYTGGKTFAQLGLALTMNDLDELPKVNITETMTSFAFDMFSDGDGDNSNTGIIPSVLVGRWQSTKNPTSLLINSNGTGYHGAQSGTWSVNGTLLTFTASNGTGSLNWSVNGNTLTLTNYSGAYGTLTAALSPFICE